SIGLLTGCAGGNSYLQLADENAGEATRAFYRNLQNLQGRGLLFGHQATLEYGYHWTQEDLAAGELRSDVKDVTGSFPSVYGFAVNAVVNPRWNGEQRLKAIERQLAWDKGIHSRGGVITYEWHMPNPDGNKSFY